MDQPVGSPPAKDRGSCNPPERKRSEYGHPAHRVMSLHNEIRRQPGEQEIPRVIAAEQSQKSPPGAAQAQNFPKARTALDPLHNPLLPARNGEEPRRKP